MGQNNLGIMSEMDFESYILSSAKESKLNNVLLYPPEFDDLYSLYTKVRREKSVAVLEFGSGWSTFALAKGLDENMHLYATIVEEEIRHPNPFHLMTIDASKDFQNVAINRIPDNLLKDRIIPITSDVRMTSVNGQICHLFDFIPAFTADFVYLDGPDCDQVLDDVHGMSVKFGSGDYQYGLPMAADLITLEPFFWPGTSIVTDGRGANASFLKSNFKREWKYSYDEDCDQHLFHLSEDPFGRISKALLEFKGI
jgi:hypothetical protein